MKKFNKLKYIVWISEVCFSCFIILALFIVQILLLNTFYRQYKTNQIEKVSSTILKSDEISIEDLETIAHENGFCISVYLNNELEVISDSYNIGCSISDKELQRKYINNLMNSNKTNTTLMITNTKYNNKAIIKSLKINNNTYIFLSTSIEPLDSSIKLLKSQYSYIIILILTVSIIVGYFISYMITKPIAKITSSAKKMENGNFNITFQNDSKIYEINELSNTLERAKNELVKTDELRRDLMANVGHDLKTPLTMIKAYAEMTKDLEGQTKEQKDNNLNIIIEETDRLTKLVNDILELSKLQSKVVKREITNFDLNELIKNIINRYDILIKKENYNIIYNGCEKAIVKADEKRIEQVIYNLINNAINYTGEDKKVTVNLIENKKNYRVEIKDTGKGIKKEEIKYVWNKYYHNDKNHKRNVYGTGLGLAIVKNIFEEYGYNYGIQSSKEGTTFYFEIKK